MRSRSKSVAERKTKQIKAKMNWRRVEELLAEKLADRVHIKLKIREAEDEDEDTIEEDEFTPDEVSEEVDAHEPTEFFITRNLNKINKVG